MVDPERPEQLAPALLALLRARLARPALAWAEAPTRLFGGNHTWVYALRLAGADAPWDGPLVLRILRPHRRPDEVVFESTLQNALAPLAPRVLLHDTDAAPLGGPFQVMERVAGRALLLADVGGDVGRLNVLATALRGFRVVLLGPWPRLLAETHARLHALPAEPVRAALAAVGMGARLDLSTHLAVLDAGLAELRADALRPAWAWLWERRGALAPPLSVCHGDLFPNQVFAADGAEPRVIDWSNALLAPGALDVGYVCAGIEMIPFPIPGLGAVQRRLSARFRAAYAALRPLEPRSFAFGEVLRSLHILLAHARHRAGRGPAPVPYDSPRALRLLERRLARYGVRVSSS